MNPPESNLSESRNEEHMLGHGFYNKNSHEQGKANNYGLPLLLEAISQINLYVAHPIRSIHPLSTPPG